MTLFRKTLLATGAVMVLAVAVGFVLPRRVYVERTIAIDAPRESVFAILNGFARFNEWSPWAALDPNAKYTYEGPATGVGPKLSWVVDPATIGAGTLAIIESRAPELVKMSFNFGPQAKAVGTMTLAAAGKGTRVTWGFETDLGSNPVSRYFGLMFDKMIGADFDRGLVALKKVAEGLP